MASLETEAGEFAQRGTQETQRTQEVQRAEAAKPAVVGPLAGDPALLGLPAFVAGSVALGLVLVGVVPAAATGASLPIILSITALGLFMATAWAAIVGQSAVASVFGLYGGFWLSYAVLLLGLNHNWFGITATSVKPTLQLFLSAWLIVMVMLTLATLRLPMGFTLLFVLVDVALVLLLFSATQTSPGLSKAAGWVVLVFAAVGVYLWMGVSSKATGGKAYPLGRAIMR
jgi:succinate-acetate transporter protein